MSFSPSFLLKKPSPTTGLCLMYMQAKWKGQRMLLSIGENVNPKLWDKGKQRLKNNNATTRDGLHLFNDKLNKLEEVAKLAFRTESVNGIPSVEQVKAHIEAFMNQNIIKQEEVVVEEKPSFYKLANSFINNEILYKGRPKSISTIKSYKTTLKHIKGFEKEESYKIEYESITLEFFYRFMNYLSRKGIGQNAKNKYTGVLKAWLSEALDLGYTDNVNFRRKKFGIGQKLSETVYLKEAEIMQVYGTPFASTALDNIKNIFILACHTGLRFSDFSTLKLEHIQEFEGERFIRKETQKTGVEVIIPLSDTVVEILKKYSTTGFPKIGCNQVFNKQLKTVCKAAGLTEKGRLTETPEKELWECVSAHTARRSFATNAHINGASNMLIMAITGHATEKAFLRYIRLSKLDSAKNFSRHLKMKQVKPSMLVAV